MKKFILTMAAITLLAMPAMADEGVKVYSNGNEVDDDGVIIDGRTMVPVRGVFEYMGYNVEWDAQTKTATLTNAKKDTVIKLTNGETTFTVNDTVITPDVPQQIVDGKFMLPLRAVGEAVNAKVGWNNDTKVATINENNNFFDINSVDKDDPIIDEMPVNVIGDDDDIDDIDDDKDDNSTVDVDDDKDDDSTVDVDDDKDDDSTVDVDDDKDDDSTVDVDDDKDDDSNVDVDDDKDDVDDKD